MEKILGEELFLTKEILKNMTEGVSLIRVSDLKIVFTNRKFEKMYGYGRNELLEQPLWILNQESDSTDSLEIAKQIREGLTQSD
ncbi:PAS domain-containing protein, partial [Thermodesulfobacteriota bacterium]